MSIYKQEFRTLSPSKDVCANCSKVGVHFYECDICHQSFYCSSGCKRSHWEIHQQDEICKEKQKIFIESLKNSKVKSFLWNILKLI